MTTKENLDQQTTTSFPRRAFNGITAIPSTIYSGIKNVVSTIFNTIASIVLFPRTAYRYVRLSAAEKISNQQAHAALESPKEVKLNHKKLAKFINSKDRELSASEMAAEFNYSLVSDDYSENSLNNENKELHKNVKRSIETKQNIDRMIEEEEVKALAAFADENQDKNPDTVLENFRLVDTRNVEVINSK